MGSEFMVRTRAGAEQLNGAGKLLATAELPESQTTDRQKDSDTINT
jgi:hypothetical protein